MSHCFDDFNPNHEQQVPESDFVLKEPLAS